MNSLQRTVVVEKVKEELCSTQRFLLYLAFVNGKTKAPTTDSINCYLKPMAHRGLIELLPDEEYKLTLAGVEEYTQIYLKDVRNEVITDATTISYFRCNFSRYHHEEFEGPPIVGSNMGVICYVNLLTLTGNLSISPRSSECDYVVLDFIDAETGESYDLYPGDTVVLGGDHYVIHKFSE